MGTRNTWTPAQDAQCRTSLQPYDVGGPGVVIDPSLAAANVAPAEMAAKAGQ